MGEARTNWSTQGERERERVEAKGRLSTCREESTPNPGKGREGEETTVRA